MLTYASAGRSPFCFGLPYYTAPFTKQPFIEMNTTPFNAKPECFFESNEFPALPSYRYPYRKTGP